MSRAPILCLEGPSAVGKTTVAAALTAEAGAFVVPEVNVLFRRPADESPLWYLERQAERWQRAVEAAGPYPLVVLDGDPFQPLWYNWAYGYAETQGLEVLEGFYRPLLQSGVLGWPDRYGVLSAPETVLRDRKAGDRERRRGGFERHLGFIEPQRCYFQAMQALRPERVRFVDAVSAEASIRAIRDATTDAETELDPVGLFDRLAVWLRAHPSEGDNP